MSEKHLSKGSVEPPRVEGILRLYSMKICPFAKRARLVLKAKNVPHDIVNIDLMNKPEWFLQINPKGQVPVLLDNGKIIVESLDVADYLDEKYPDQTPLYPADAALKKRDQEFMRTALGPATSPLVKVQYSTAPYTPEKALGEILPAAQILEDELAKRGKFFGGDKPGMIDLMLWPWAERSATLPGLLGVEKLPLKEDQIPKLRKWAKDMMQVDAVKQLYTPPDILVKACLAKRNGTLDYPTLFNE